MSTAPARKSIKSRKRVRDAREKLERVISLFGCAYGEAQWTNGYRTAKNSDPSHKETVASELFQREVKQWQYLEQVARVNVNRALVAYTKALRADGKAR